MPKPTIRNSWKHFWCMLAHGAHHEVDEIHPQSRLMKITCSKCRVWWTEPK